MRNEARNNTEKQILKHCAKIISALIKRGHLTASIRIEREGDVFGVVDNLPETKFINIFVWPDGFLQYRHADGSFEGMAKSEESIIKILEDHPYE